MCWPALLPVIKAHRPDLVIEVLPDFQISDKTIR